MKGRNAIEAAAEFSSSVSMDSVPLKVTTAAKRSLLDALGCALGAHRTSVGVAVSRLAERMKGGTCSAVGLTAKYAPPTAAKLNALLVNALDFDDTYSSHLSATVVPSCLAAADLMDASGTELLAGLVAGYELSARLGKSLKRASERTTLHGHGTWQGVGAAFGAARVLGLSASETAAAVAIAASNAPVPSVMKTVYGMAGPTDVKNNFAAASDAAVTASLMAAEGFTAPRDILDGETGFWRMIGCDDFDGDELTQGLGSSFRCLGIGLKPYPSCRLTQTSVGLAAELIANSGAVAADILKIHVKTIPILARTPFTDTAPSTMTAAQYSLPYAISAAIVGVPPGPDWFSHDSMSDPRINALSAQVTVATSPDVEARKLEPTDVPTEMTITLRDGHTLSGEATVAYGDSRKPLPWTEVVDKFHRNAGKVASEGVATFPESVLALESIESTTRDLQGRLAI